MTAFSTGDWWSAIVGRVGIPVGSKPLVCDSGVCKQAQSSDELCQWYEEAARLQKVINVVALARSAVAAVGSSEPNSESSSTVRLCDCDCVSLPCQPSIGAATSGRFNAVLWRAEDSQLKGKLCVLPYVQLAGECRPASAQHQPSSQPQHSPTQPSTAQQAALDASVCCVTVQPFASLHAHTAIAPPHAHPPASPTDTANSHNTQQHTHTHILDRPLHSCDKQAKQHINTIAYRHTATDKHRQHSHHHQYAQLLFTAQRAAAHC